jgi:cytochrome bd-type quinol oxidase subunit 2
MEETWNTCINSNVTGANGVATFQCIEVIFGNLVRAIMALAGVGLFIMLLTGGFNFLLAGGDQKKIEKAKGTLSAAAIGLVVIVVSFLILRAIAEITGINNITTFNILWPNP